MSKRFQVALSFPGEHRTVVEQIANVLAERLTKPAVFYDRFYESELARPNLDTYLQNIYHNDSELIVVFLCQDYNHKEWCHLEARAIRDLIKKRRDDEVMFIRLDDGDVDGVFSVDGYVDAKGRPAREIAQVVIDRLAHVLGTSDFPPPREASGPPEQISIGALRTRHAKAFVDRNEGLVFLDAAWNDPGTHIAEVVATGGVGKSRLVLRWLNQMAPDFLGAERVFGHSFYTQGHRYDPASSSDGFMMSALKFFGDPNPKQGSPQERGGRLAELVRKKRTLLILDGLEPLQYPPTADAPGPPGAIRDVGLAMLVSELAALNNGLCVITTRVAVLDIESWYKTVSVKHLDLLPDDAGAQLLSELGVDGTDEELRKASRAVSGHALAVTLLGNYLRMAFGGDIRRLPDVELRKTIESDSHARLIMQKYESWLGDGPELSILRLLGLFDRPAGDQELDQLRSEPAIPGLTDKLVGLGQDEWNTAVTKLQECGLLSQRYPEEPVSEIDTHPLIREYFSDQLAEVFPAAARAAHERLYRYLLQSVAKSPRSIDEIILLCRAVRHGCGAGLVQESFDDLIRERVFSQKREVLYGKSGVAPSLLPALQQYFEGSFPVRVKLADRLDQVMLLLWTGHCLASAEGFGTDRVNRVFQCARETSDPLGVPQLSMRALIGLFYCKHYRSEINEASSIVEDMDAIAGRDASPELLITAAQARAETDYYLGRFSNCCETADSHLESKTPDDASLIPLFDTWVAFLGWRAWGCVNLGRPGRGVAAVDEAIEYVRKLEASNAKRTMAHSKGLALLNAAVVRFENREASELRSVVHELHELAKTRRHFIFWWALLELMDGAAHLLTENCEAAVDALRAGTEKWVRIDNVRGLSRFDCWLAQAQLQKGKLDAAAGSLETAFDKALNGEHFYLAELHRVRAELMRRRDPDHTANVESEYRTALHVADGQQAWMLKVRAALGYHDFTQEHGGDVDEAIRILDDAYQRCDPSYMTRDFRAAERILNS